MQKFSTQYAKTIINNRIKVLFAALLLMVISIMTISSNPLRHNNSNEMCFIHVSLVPKIGRDGESKTKPTQNSVKDLRQLGLFPDIMIVRSETEIDVKTRDKISISIINKNYI